MSSPPIGHDDVLSRLAPATPTVYKTRVKAEPARIQASAFFEVGITIAGALAAVLVLLLVRSTPLTPI